MIILGIDTSCEQASCAVFKDGEIWERRSKPDKKKHSETLMPMVDEFLKVKGIRVTDIDLFAVSGGPGSFTGLRIGMAAIKGMAYTVKKQVAVIKTLDILANSFKSSAETVCPMIDARNNQVYTAIYKYSNGLFKPATEYLGMKIEDLANKLKEYNKVSICGDASIKHYNFLTEHGVICKEPDKVHLYPSSGILVSMAAEGSGDVVDPSEAVPYYLRVSQAERFHG